MWSCKRQGRGDAGDAGARERKKDGDCGRAGEGISECVSAAGRGREGGGGGGAVSEEER